MRFQPLIRRISLVPVAAAAAGIVLAGCGSSGSPKSSSSPSPSSASPTATGAASSAAAIKANWEAFFSASTPVARRVALLQNGQLFQKLIAAQAKSSLASSASAKVTSVTNISATQATVKYTILVGGVPALSGQKGVAVNEGGTWKVGDASFCGLLVLQNSGKTTGLPAACQSAG